MLDKFSKAISAFLAGGFAFVFMVLPNLTAPAAAQDIRPSPERKVSIARIQIVEAPAKSFRDKTMRPIIAVPADRDVHVYVEPAGLATKFEGGEVRAHMVIDLEVRAADGSVLRDGKGIVQLPIAVKAQSHMPLKDIYANIKIDALRLQSGRYVLMVRIHDEFGHTTGERTIAFTQIAASPAQGPAAQGPAAQIPTTR